MNAKTPTELLTGLKNRQLEELEATWVEQATKVIEMIFDAGRAAGLNNEEQLELIQHFASRKRRDETIQTLLDSTKLPMQVRQFLEKELPSMGIAQQHAMLWAVEDCVAQA